MFEGKTVLHVGCGGNPLPSWLDGATETRLDIDDTYKPDVVADMRDFEAGKYDVVYCSHALEHLYPHEVVPTLENFRRSLNNGGIAVIIVPNLENVKPTRETLYQSDAGPISGLDMIYGMGKLLKDSPYMAHHTGFVPETLKQDMQKAGFEAKVMADDSYNLIGIGS